MPTRHRSRIDNTILHSMLVLACLSGCNSTLLPASDFPDRHALAQEQLQQSRYLTLEQVVTQTAADAMGDAKAARAAAYQANKVAMESQKMADALKATTDELRALLDQVRNEVATFEAKRETEGHEPISAPNKVGTLIVALMRPPDAALTVGATGSEVRQLHLLLILGGYLKETTVRDKYTKVTAEAVKALQRDYKLTPNGLFDIATAQQLATRLGAALAPIMLLPGSPMGHTAH